MPELHSILGSLFADITHSVFASDMYSRDISKYYEQDALLRHFPVPRTEIEELEVALKFAISDVLLNPTQAVGREANAANVFIDFSYDLSEGYASELPGLLRDLRKVLPKELQEELTWEAIDEAVSGERTIDLRQELLRYFQRDKGSLIEKGQFKADRAREGVRGILRKHLNFGVPKNVREWEESQYGLLEKLCEGTNLAGRLEGLEKPLQYAWNQEGDFKLDVEITAAKLNELAPEKLSSVQVKTRVRNYKWSEIEHPGRKSWWTLNPE